MRLFPLMCCVLLAACTLGAPKGGDKPSRPIENPITGAAIATTAIDAPAPVAPTVKPSEPAKPVATPPVEPVVVAPPPHIASPQELACIKRHGDWRKAGRSGGEACFTQTKDAGKFCKRESDCEGFCLARSNTCAPFSPMFGCNDILQDNGAMVTLCID